jgi:hypothetical protein
MYIHDTYVWSSTHTFFLYVCILYSLYIHVGAIWGYVCTENSIFICMYVVCRNFFVLECEVGCMIYTHVYLCIFIRTYVHMHVHNVCMYIGFRIILMCLLGCMIYTHLYVCMIMRTYVHAYAYVCTHRFANYLMRVHKKLCACVYLRTYIDI